ncbi:hypothetical protein COOONC_09347 [Cooperia oncophora]
MKRNCMKKQRQTSLFLQSALTRIKTAVSNLQEKIDKMENQFANAKKADQKELMLEVQEIEKESQFSQHLATAEVFVDKLEAQLSEVRVNLTKAQRNPSYHHPTIAWEVTLLKAQLGRVGAMHHPRTVPFMI